MEIKKGISYRHPDSGLQIAVADSGGAKAVFPLAL